MAMEFKEFPKMARLSREVIVTEKIDGTNSSIFIQDLALEEDTNDSNIVAIGAGFNGEHSFTMRVGSRTRWITPKNDNFGFASWVHSNATELFKLGEGHHFGEWWGSGIQRGYGLPKGEKRFSLFNTSRWDGELRPNCCYVVPILYQGVFDTAMIEGALTLLGATGSKAAPGFMKPEGIVVFHTAGNVGFKKTIDGDQHKGIK